MNDIINEIPMHSNFHYTSSQLSEQSSSSSSFTNSVSNDSLSDIDEKIVESPQPYNFFASPTLHDQLVSSTLGNYHLYYPKECHNNSSILDKNMRGLIVDNQNQVLVPGYSFVEEYSPLEWIENGMVIPPHSYITDAYEGTVLRVWFDEKWNVSTFKTIDASMSHWGSRISFREQFEQCLTTYEFLETDKIYYFLLTANIDTRLVCVNQQLSSRLYFMCYFHNKKGPMFPRLHPLAQSPRDFERLIQPLPVRLLDNNTLLPYVSSIDPLVQPGVYIFHTHGIIKVVHPIYQQYLSVRANEPNLLKRYIQLRTTTLPLVMFKRLFPEYVERADMFEERIRKRIINILRVYRNNFIEKRPRIMLDKVSYQIMRKCHDLHCLTQERITYNHVAKIMNELPLDVLYKYGKFV